MEENCLASEAYRLRRDNPDFSLETRRLLRFECIIFYYKFSFNLLCLIKISYIEVLILLSMPSPQKTKNIIIHSSNIEIICSHRFTSSIENIGDADFRPNIPKSHWVWHGCHQHYHSMEVHAI